MKLSKFQVAELLSRYQILLDGDAAPPTEGRLKKTCAILKRRQVLDHNLVVTPLGIAEAVKRGGTPYPKNAQEWFDVQQKAALKRDRGVRDVIQGLGESELEGDDFLDLIEAEAAKLQRSA